MTESSYLSREPMLEMFVFETNQFLEQLEEILLHSEKSNRISAENINEIFRIMHTIKGSASMMMYSNIASLAHAVEDLFYLIREKKPAKLNNSAVCDLVFSACDFIKAEIGKIESGKEADGNVDLQIESIRRFLESMKGRKGKLSAEMPKEKSRFYISSYQPQGENSLQKYRIKVFFEEGCQMENIRAYTIIHNLEAIAKELLFRPNSIIEDNTCCQSIIEKGFDIYIETEHPVKEIESSIQSAIVIKSFDIVPVDDYSHEVEDLIVKTAKTEAVPEEANDTSHVSEEDKQGSLAAGAKQSIISVNTSKLDKLMDLVGEIVTTESMVANNPDLTGLKLDNFHKAARQLRKLTDELQDIVMSIRMVPIAATFQKMHRIVRDMSKKLSKDVELVIQGEDTEVDKNIIDHLSDPLMHLIRNAMDHGIETDEERVLKGKHEKGRILLDARNTGGDVTLTIQDNGRGLHKERIIEKARRNGLIAKSEAELSDKEVYALILLPGFSTKEEVTEFSGRGVGMDVVKRNIEKVGGSISIDSMPDTGTTISIRIPLTLAIIEGMEVAVGSSLFTIPITSIKESFKINEKNVITDTCGNELIIIRGQCYPIIRLHRKFKLLTDVTRLEEGIMVMIEGNEKAACLFVDKLIGEQQVVLKSIPSYLSQFDVKKCGIGGCTILGDGNISLILDVIRMIDSTT